MLLEPRSRPHLLAPARDLGIFLKPYPSGVAFVAAADRANALDAAIVARGLGRAQVIELAKFFSQKMVGTAPRAPLPTLRTEAGGRRLTRHEISFAFRFAAGARGQAGFRRR
jgi:hypothetical protein